MFVRYMLYFTQTFTRAVIDLFYISNIWMLFSFSISETLLQLLQLYPFKRFKTGLEWTRGGGGKKQISPRAHLETFFPPPSHLNPTKKQIGA